MFQIRATMECYVCYEPASSSNPFLFSTPCQCKGSIKLHNSCLKKMIETCGDSCSICKSKYKNTNNNRSPKRTRSNYHYEDESDLAIAEELYRSELEEAELLTSRFTHRESTTHNVESPIEETVPRREFDKLNKENQKLKEENKAMKELLEVLLSKV